MTRVLLIEDNPGDVRLIREMLNEAEDADFQFEHADRISKGLERVARGGIDAVLLDLALPDGRGFPTFKKVQTGAASIPIILLTDLEDEDLAIAAVRQGAQDYLVKGQIDSTMLARSIRYAIERERQRRALGSASLLDPSTGLYTRAGFLTIARKPFQIAQRLGTPMWMLFVNIDGLKSINDQHGQAAGDQSVADIAAVLQSAFRESDILGRLGGNEFVVLAMEPSHGAHEATLAKLAEALAAANAAPGRKFPLAVSTALVAYDSASPSSVEELIAKADAQLVGAKRGR